jgi:hypothetical protein
MTPSGELLKQCEEEQKMLIVFVRKQDFISGTEMMTRFSLYPANYLHAFIIPNDETFEMAKARIVAQLEKATNESPMWFAPAGFKRGILDKEDVKGVLYDQKDEDMEGPAL